MRISPISTLTPNCFATWVIMNVINGIAKGGSLCRNLGKEPTDGHVLEFSTDWPPSSDAGFLSELSDTLQILRP